MDGPLMKRALWGLLLCAAPLWSQAFDLVLTGGRIVDGSGNPWYRADIGIRAGRIAEIGRLASRPAQRTIDVHGQVISPGFIDMMGTNSEPLLAGRNSAQSKLRQGITTILAGEGGSVAPSRKWPRFREYSQALERAGIAINVVHDVGAAQVRQMVIGDENRKPTAAQMERMKALVNEAMEDGAVGLSTALIYPPGTYATTEEIVELAKVAARHGGIYLTHMRNESNQVLDAIRESIRIGEEGGLPVHIFHLKAAGEQNWPLMAQAISLIQSARDRGLEVTADIYPYIRNGIGLGSFLHPRHYAAGRTAFLQTLGDRKVREELRREVETTSDWENWYLHVGRNWDNVLIAQVDEGMDKRFEGKSIAEVAKLRSVDEWTAFFDLVQAGQVQVNPKSMNEDQKHQALRTEWISVCTDAPPTDIATTSNAHPRAFGSFVRILSKYVREEKVISLAAAVRQMSSLPANQLHLYDRGRIAPGMAADLLVFDPDHLEDVASFTKPLAFPKGMPYVIVNGQVEIDDGRFTPANGGQVLRAH